MQGISINARISHYFGGKKWYLLPDDWWNRMEPWNTQIIIIFGHPNQTLNLHNSFLSFPNLILIVTFSFW